MKDVKEKVYPHSQAKLDLYKDYLAEYLPILGNSPYVDKINLFDIFCGSGIYKDGKLGSPLIAASQILNTILSFQEKGKRIKPISLFINDFEKKKVDGVKDIIDSLPLDNCTVEAFNLDAEDMFTIVAERIQTFSKRERTLVFIDPYGYSKIRKHNIQPILENKKTEIILFLPVAQMYRFHKQANDEPHNKAYEHLRNFAEDFYGTNNYFKDIFEYINCLAKTFSFDKQFYTSSHYIQRDKANYYAVFFISPHIYGLEKFLEVKWKNDSLGKGYNIKSNSNTLFSETIEEYDKSLTAESLKKIILEALQKAKHTTNLKMYEFILKNQFLPTHANQVLRELREMKKIVIEDINGNPITGRKSLDLSYENHKSKKPSVIFKIVEHGTIKH